jgi:hypothetical protein
MEIHLRRLVIEGTKPREISSVELAQSLCAIHGVDECELVVTDVDSRTMTLKFTIRGPNINYAELRKAMDDNSVAVKGVDEITATKVRKPAKT